MQHTQWVLLAPKHHTYHSWTHIPVLPPHQKKKKRRGIYKLVDWTLTLIGIDLLGWWLDIYFSYPLDLIFFIKGIVFLCLFVNSHLCSFLLTTSKITVPCIELHKTNMPQVNIIKGQVNIISVRLIKDNVQDD